MVMRHELTATVVRGRRRETLARLRLFIAFGALSSAAYLATIMIGVDVVGLPVVPAAMLAFVIGTLVSYVLNTRFTYGDDIGWKNFNRFSVVVALGFVLNVAITWILARLGVHYIMSSLIVFVVVPMFNFIAHARFTYREGGSK